MKRRCRICFKNKSIDGYWNVTHYQCINCLNRRRRIRARRQRGPKPKINCKRCGQIFTQTKKSGLYCSVPCKAAVNYQRHRAARRAQSKKYRASSRGQRRLLMYQKTHKEQIKNAFKAWYIASRDQGYYKEPSRRLKRSLQAAKTRAKRDGIRFDDILLEVFVTPPARCACCNAALDYSYAIRDKSDLRNSRSPSIDQVIPGAGYTVKNTVIVCTRCNILKADASLLELEHLVRYVRRFTRLQKRHK